MEVLLGCFFLLFIHDLAESVKVEVFEHIVLCQVYIAKWASVMPINCLVDAFATIDVPTSSNKAVVDLIEANITQKFLFKGFDADLEIFV